jgi:hypothetical protein
MSDIAADIPVIELDGLRSGRRDDLERIGRGASDSSRLRITAFLRR